MVSGLWETGDMKQPPTDRPCPKCEAKTNNPCTNEKGQIMRGWHSERWPANEDFSQAAARTVREAPKDR
jgi:hypothetical protein